MQGGALVKELPSGASAHGRRCTAHQATHAAGQEGQEGKEGRSGQASSLVALGGRGQKACSAAWRGLRGKPLAARRGWGSRRDPSPAVALVRQVVLWGQLSPVSADTNITQTRQGAHPPAVALVHQVMVRRQARQPPLQRQLRAPRALPGRLQRRRQLPAGDEGSDEIRAPLGALGPAQAGRRPSVRPSACNAVPAPNQPPLHASPPRAGPHMCSQGCAATSSRLARRAGSVSSTRFSRSTHSGELRARARAGRCGAWAGRPSPGRAPTPRCRAPSLGLAGGRASRAAPHVYRFSRGATHSSSTYGRTNLLSVQRPARSWCLRAARHERAAAARGVSWWWPGRAAACPPGSNAHCWQAPALALAAQTSPGLPTAPHFTPRHNFDVRRTALTGSASPPPCRRRRGGCQRGRRRRAGPPARCRPPTRPPPLRLVDEGPGCTGWGSDECGQQVAGHRAASTGARQRGWAPGWRRSSAAAHPGCRPRATAGSL